MPAVPVVIGGLIATGVAEVIGAAAITAIVGSTVSAAVATAVGAGIIAGGVAAIQGGSVSDVLKSAVVGGVASYAGAQVGNYIGNSVSAALDTSVPSSLGAYGADVAENAAGLSGISKSILGSVSSGITQSVIKGQPVGVGALSGLATGVVSSLDATFKTSPKWEVLGRAGQEAVKAATAASIVGGQPAEAAMAAALRTTNILGDAISYAPASVKAALNDPANAGTAQFLLGSVDNTISGLISGKNLTEAAQAGIARSVGTYLGDALKSNLTTYVNNAQKAYTTATSEEQKTKQAQQEAQSLVDRYNSISGEYNARLQHREELVKDFTETAKAAQELSDWSQQHPMRGGYHKSAEAAFLRKQAEDKLNALNEYTNKEVNGYYNSVKPELEGIPEKLKTFEAQAAKYQSAIDELKARTDTITATTATIINDTKKATVAGIAPDFDAGAYAKLNEVKGDPYEHFLTQGYDSKLPTNYESGADAALKSIGYKASPDEVKQVADLFKKSADPDVALGKFYDEHWVTQEEAAAAAKQAGFDLTPEQLKAFVGQASAGQNKVLGNVEQTAKLKQETQTKVEQMSNNALAEVAAKLGVGVGAVSNALKSGALSEAATTQLRKLAADSMVRQFGAFAANDPRIFAEAQGGALEAAAKRYGLGDLAAYIGRAANTGLLGLGLLTYSPDVGAPDTKQSLIPGLKLTSDQEKSLTSILGSMSPAEVQALQQKVAGLPTADRESYVKALASNSPGMEIEITGAGSIGTTPTPTPVTPTPTPVTPTPTPVTPTPTPVTPTPVTPTPVTPTPVTPTPVTPTPVTPTPVTPSAADEITKALEDLNFRDNTTAGLENLKTGLGQLGTSTTQQFGDVNARIVELQKQGLTQAEATNKALLELSSGQATLGQQQAAQAAAAKEAADKAAANQQATQTQFGDVNARIVELMRQGADYQTATTQAQTELKQGQAQLGTKVGELGTQVGQIGTKVGDLGTTLGGQIAGLGTQLTAAKQQTAQAQRQANMGTLFGLLGGFGGQQAAPPAAAPITPANIGYVYDIGGKSIFANPQQEKAFVSPYAEGGTVEDLMKILRG